MPPSVILQEWFLDGLDQEIRMMIILKEPVDYQATKTLALSLESLMDRWGKPVIPFNWNPRKETHPPQPQ